MRPLTAALLVAVGFVLTACVNPRWDPQYERLKCSDSAFCVDSNYRTASNHR